MPCHLPTRVLVVRSSAALHFGRFISFGARRRSSLGIVAALVLFIPCEY
jgi:hypothetical protein